MDSGRRTLSRGVLLHEAVGVADEAGVAALTIRSLAQRVGASPMAIYHHLAGKEEILDGIVDLVFAEIELPAPGAPWREAARRRACSARAALRRHPWAVTLLSSRTNPGPATLRHHEAVLASLRQGGFDLPTAAHAVALVDSYVYGFAIQEAALPFDAAGAPGPMAEAFGELLASGSHPHLTELVTQHVARPGYSFGDEFDLGLEVVLDGLERWVSAAPGTGRPEPSAS